MFIGRLGARIALLCGAVLASLGLMAVSASAETISFTKIGCEVWTAPTSVVVRVEAVGAAGASVSKGGGSGSGDAVLGTVGRLAGEHLEVCVDQGGGLGGGLGGEPTQRLQEGGGWSGVIFGETKTQAMVAVLGAGGGGGSGTEGGNGGNAADAGATAVEECPAGGAGTLTEGGAGGGYCKVLHTTEEFGGTGAELQGGHGGYYYSLSKFGGGGGGGYFGGGGGTFPAGGGGGSDFCAHGAVECSTDAAVGTVHGAGAGANEAHVTLTTNSGGIPAVTKVSTNSGPANGDKVSIITGTGFKHVSSVKFGGVSATKYSVNEAGTEIGVVAPAQEVAGTVDVTVTNLFGTSKTTTKDHYKYLPVITSVFPNSGPTTGINEWGAAWITGYGFAEGFPSATAVSYGTTAVASEHTSCFPDTFCEVWVPAHAAGTVDITVKVNGATSLKTKADKFTYK